MQYYFCHLSFFLKFVLLFSNSLLQYKPNKHYSRIGNEFIFLISYLYFKDFFCLIIGYCKFSTSLLNFWTHFEVTSPICRLWPQIYSSFRLFWPAIFPTFFLVAKRISHQTKNWMLQIFFWQGFVKRNCYDSADSHRLCESFYSKRNLFSKILQVQFFIQLQIFAIKSTNWTKYSYLFNVTMEKTH